MQRIQHTLKLLLIALAVASPAPMIGGCNTAEGFGKDMEEAGEEIQEETRDDADEIDD